MGPRSRSSAAFEPAEPARGGVSGPSSLKETDWERRGGGILLAAPGRGRASCPAVPVLGCPMSGPRSLKETTWGERGGGVILLAAPKSGSCPTARVLGCPMSDSSPLSWPPTAKPHQASSSSLHCLPQAPEQSASLLCLLTSEPVTREDAPALLLAMLVNARPTGLVAPPLYERWAQTPSGAHSTTKIAAATYVREEPSNRSRRS